MIIDKRAGAAMILLLSSLLCIMTDLLYSAGYIMIITALAILTIYRFYLLKAIDIKTIAILLVGLFSYFIMTENIRATVRWKSPLVSVLLLLAVYLCSNQMKENNISFSFKVQKVLDFFYFIIYIYCFNVLMIFTKDNLKDWSQRYYQLDAFPFGWHSVTFSVVMIFLFMLGIKLNHKRLTVIMALFSWIVLPARTYKLFVLSYVLLTLFNKQWKKIRKLRLFNSYFKLMLWMVLFIILGSLFWEYVVIDRVAVKTSHTSLFDTSNMERFRTIIYSLIVIIKQHLLFKGMTIVSYTDYGLLYDNGWEIINGPHNSYLDVALNYSVFLALIYFYTISKVFDRLVVDEKCEKLIVSYLLTACILHELFESYHLLLLLTVIVLPDVRTNIKRKTLFRVKVSV